MRLLVCCVVAVSLISTACNETRGPLLLRNPGAPTPTLGPPPAPPGTSPNAIPIALGQTVTGVVTLSDPACDTRHDDVPDPCQRFAIAISTSGMLKVQVISQGPSTLTLRVGSVRRYGVTAVSGAAAVQAGATYEVSVALHDPVGGNTSQMFELATSLDPF
jgi:hypothetical protein